MTTAAIDRVWSIPAPLRALAPDASGLLDAANEQAWRAVSPVLLEQLRLRMASLLGNAAGMLRRSAPAQRGGLAESKIAQLANYYSADAFTELERDCLEFAEQFVIDVAGPMAEYTSRVHKHFPGEQLNTFVGALYLTEYTQRLELMANALLEAPAQSDDADQITIASQRPSTGLGQILHDFQDAVVRLKTLDPVLTELVRLRCGRVHNCRICQTLRLADARAAGADDAMTAKIDFYEASDLDDRTKTALRITDAMISGSGPLDGAAVAQARAAFSPQELAELCLDVTKWSTQKIRVSQGTDTAEALPTNADGVSFFNFDESGRAAGFSATVRTS